jgi:hypothetical protein
VLIKNQYLESYLGSPEDGNPLAVANTLLGKFESSEFYHRDGGISGFIVRQFLSWSVFMAANFSWRDSSLAASWIDGNNACSTHLFTPTIICFKSYNTVSAGVSSLRGSGRSLLIFSQAFSLG